MKKYSLLSIDGIRFGHEFEVIFTSDKKVSIKNIHDGSFMEKDLKFLGWFDIFNYHCDEDEIDKGYPFNVLLEGDNGKQLYLNVI